MKKLFFILLLAGTSLACSSQNYFPKGFWAGELVSGTNIILIDSITMTATDTAMWSGGNKIGLGASAGGGGGGGDGAFYFAGSGILIDDGDTISIGGALDSIMTITGTEVNYFEIRMSDAGDRSVILRFNAADGLSMRGYSTDAYGGDSGYFAVDSNKIVMAQHSGASEKSITMDTATTTGIVVRDHVAGKGIVFFDDYSPSYGDLSATNHLWQGTHLGYQLLDATIYSPGYAQHGGVLVYDSTGRAAGTDHYQIEDFVPADKAVEIGLRKCDTILFSNTTVDTVLTLAEGDVIDKIEVFIETTFDGSGTNLLDVGIIGDTDRYENDLDLGVASDFYGLANLSDRMSAARYIIFQYFDSNADAANGEAYIYVYYTKY